MNCLTLRVRRSTEPPTLKVNRATEPMEITIGMVCSVFLAYDFNDDFNDDFK